MRIAQALIDHGADLAPMRGWGPTPLEYAKLKSKPKLEALLEELWRQKRAYVPKFRRTGGQEL